ncbi:MAG: cobalamin synthase [Actinomycetota bacterium]
MSGLPPFGALAALQFLTRVPIRLSRAPSMPGIVVWFPVAGAAIGMAVGGAAAGAWHLVPPLVAGALAVTVGLLVTGAFHEDGLGDIADAFGGGYTLERRLEILKDSRHGTYGVAAMCASIVVRVVSLGSLPGPAVMFAAAVAAHVMARTAAVWLMAAAPLATHRGLGADYGQSTTPRRAITAGVLGAAITCAVFTLFADAWWTLPVALTAAGSVALTGALAVRKIQGISGDVLGAAEQVAEAAILVVVSGLAIS